jgi:hypothetical protein
MIQQYDPDTDVETIQKPVIGQNPGEPPITSPATNSQATEVKTTPYDVSQPYLGLIEKYRPKPDETDMNAQKRIAKGNALGEAFRVLIDSVGASKGATVVPRTAPTNAVMKAVDNYYKMKEANKAEQTGWDKLELQQGLGAISAEKQHQYEESKRAEEEGYKTKEREAGEQFQSGEKAKERGFNAAEASHNRVLKADEFGQEMDFKKSNESAKNRIEQEKVDVARQKVNSIPLSRLNHLEINDEEGGKVLAVPASQTKQILTYLEEDPTLSGRMNSTDQSMSETAKSLALMKTSFNPQMSATAIEKVIAENFNQASPETKQKIRQFIGTTNAAPPAGAGKTDEPFLFYKHPAPEIIENKNSTMVDVKNAPPAGAAPANQPAEALQPEQVQNIQKIMGAKNYTPEVKRSAIYNYLVSQGFDAPSAKGAADAVYKSIIGK